MLPQQATPPDWSSPDLAARKPHLIRQFEKTYQDLLMKMDEVAKFIDMKPGSYRQSRGALMVSAYEDAWGIENAGCMLMSFIQKSPNEELSAEDHARFSHLMSHSFDIGDYLLTETGVRSYEEVFAQRREAMTPFLDEDLKDHPEAEILFAKGFVVYGGMSMPGWNRKGLSDYLRGLLVDAEARTIKEQTAPLVGEHAEVSSRL